MKNLFFLNTFLFIFGFISAQQVPVISAKAVSKLQYSEKDFKDWLKYESLMYEDGEIKEPSSISLSISEKKFIKEYEKRFLNNGGDDRMQEPMAPWQIEGIGCSWYCGGTYEIKASSFLADHGKNTYKFENIEDNDTRTAWVEGVKGYGIGEYIEFIFPYYGARATEVYLANGYNKDENTWKNNSRVKTLKIYEDNKLTGIVNLKDTRDLQFFKLPHPFPVRQENEERFETVDDEGNILNSTKLKFVIAEVYKGNKYEDTAISEIMFDGIDVHCLAKGTMVMMKNKKKQEIEKIKPGDMVLSYNTDKGIFEPQKVVRVHKAIHKELIKLETGVVDITTTEDHPFFSDGKWLSYNPQKTKNYSRYATVPIEKYKEGDFINYYDEKDGLLSVYIDKITLIKESTETYTLELEKEGAFIANGLIVGQE